MISIARNKSKIMCVCVFERESTVPLAYLGVEIEPMTLNPQAWLSLA